MGGLIRKSIYETWASTMFFAVGMFAFQIVMAVILPNFQEGLGDILEHLKFVQYIIAALLGTEVSAQIGPKAFSAFPWVHPAMLALMWAHGIMYCTRVPAAEVERGTIDALLSLPVKRSTVLLSDTVVWIIWGCVLAGFALVGNVVGALLSKQQGAVMLLPRVGVAVNLLCLYLCVGAIARVLSAMCDHRGRAIGIAFAVVVSSFVLHTLANFSEGFRGLAFLGLLKYYRPLQVLAVGEYPFGDIVVLLAVMVVLWSLSVLVFMRRDIRTT